MTLGNPPSAALVPESNPQTDSDLETDSTTERSEGLDAPSDTTSLRAWETDLSGWGCFRRIATRVIRVERWRELCSAVRGLDDSGLIARGLGRAYGDSAVNADGLTMLCTKLDRILEFDPQTGLIESEAGLSLGRLLEFAVPRGFFPTVVPGTKFVTIGGAIAGDVHGKNHHRAGAFGQALESIRLVDANGEIRTCSRTQNADLFQATLGGMGLTGVILSARFRLKPVESAWLRVQTTRLPDLDAALERVRDDADDLEYSVFWVDGLTRGGSFGRSVMYRADHLRIDDLDTDQARDPKRIESPRGLPIPSQLPGGLLNPASVRLHNRLYYRKNRDGVRVQHYHRFFHPLDGLRNWNRLYGRAGFVQYQAVVPLDGGDKAIRQMLEAVQTRAVWPYLVIMKRLGVASEGLLGFPRPGLTLAMDLPGGSRSLVEAVHALDRIVLEHGGRIYLAKDSLSSADAFSSMYAETLDRFRAIKEAVDPSDRFRSAQAERLGLVRPKETRR